MNIERFLQYGSIGILPFIANGCPPPERNKQPDTKIEKIFPNDGTVVYTITGIDHDGRVKALHVNYNKRGWESFSTNAPESSRYYVREVEANNLLEAIAEDNKGAKDKSPAQTEFLVPSLESAFSMIKAILDVRKDEYLSYEADPKAKTIIFVQKDDMIKEIGVDFLVRLPEDKYAVINYIGLDDDLDKAFSDEAFIEEDPQGRALYLYRLPLEEILGRADEYVQRGFRK